MEKTIAVLGATGSVGQQALEVAASRGYRVDYLTAASNVGAMENLARRFKPRAVNMTDPAAAAALKTALADTDVRVTSGKKALLDGIAESAADVVVNSILGGAGLLPTLATIDAGRRLALANKESLVMAGSEVMSRAAARGVEIIPVDSEHSAIFQCLKSGRQSEIKRILLTASGGPFFGRSRDELCRVTVADTLAHPTWRMGRKITVDSATLMNKGFEIIEATHLFGVEPDAVEVLVHRESILHSAIEYLDNTVIGQMSLPDMRMCVQYAVDYPCRMPSASAALDLFSVGSLSFARPDTEAFSLLFLARRAIAAGGATPAVMNAADEIAVEAFLTERIGFYGISDLVCATVEKLSAAKNAQSVDEILAYDKEARAVAKSLIK